MTDYAIVAQELSVLGEKMREVERRLGEVEKVNARLEEAALTTRTFHERDLASLGRRVRGDAAHRNSETPTMSYPDNEAARARREGS